MKIISGTDEGLYGWVALNYAQGLLQQPHPKSGDVGPEVSTLGALDLGGSSLEVSWVFADVAVHPGTQLCM